MYNDQELLEYDGLSENFEDLGSLEDLEASSDFEDLEDFEDFEDLETPLSGKKLLKPIARGVSKAGKIHANHVLKKVVQQAAKSAGAAIAGSAGATLGGKEAIRALKELDSMGEFEGDFETDPEMEMQDMGISPQIIAEMQHIATLAANAKSDQEADQFIGALANIAGSILPSLLGGGNREMYYETDPEAERDEFLPLAALAPLAFKALPFITKGIKAAGRLLTSPNVKRFVGNAARGLGSMAMKSVGNVARAVQGGAPLNRATITRGIAGGVAQTYGNPQVYSRTIHRNQAHWHQRCRRMGYIPAYRRY